MAHHGAFHAAYLVQSLDSLVLAVAQSAQLSLARLTMLAEPAYTGLHPFLGDGTPAASGVMIVEYSAASALAELRALATPAGIQAVTLSRGVEEDASFATLAARQALEAVSRFRAVLAAELVASLRCLRMQGVAAARAGQRARLPRRARRRRSRHARPRPDLRPDPGRGAGRRAARARGPVQRQAGWLGLLERRVLLRRLAATFWPALVPGDQVDDGGVARAGANMACSSGWTRARSTSACASAASLVSARWARVSCWTTRPSSSRWERWASASRSVIAVVNSACSAARMVNRVR